MLISFIPGSFSLRGVIKLSFQYYIEMNIHYRVTAFEKSVGKKKEKPWTPFLPPVHAALNRQSSPGLAKQHRASMCFWAGALSSAGVPSCGTRRSRQRWRVLRVGAAGTMRTVWGSPGTPSRRQRHLSSSWSVWAPVGRLQSSFGLLGPALLWAALQHWKNLQVFRKMDKRALMGEWNGVGIGLEAGSLWNKRELKGMSQLSLLNNVVLKIWLIKWSNKVNLLAHKAGRAFHQHSL